MRIRKIVFSDVLAVKKLIEELENNQFQMDIFIDIFQEYLERKNAFVWVMEKEGQVIGFLSCFGQRLLHHQDWVFEIQELVINGPFQNKGYGKMMLEKLVEEMKRNKVFSLEVTTNKLRTQAHAFYKACGFLNSHEKFTMYF